MRLQGRAACVTGTSRGIGREIALAFAGEGADLAVVARTSADLASLKAEIELLGVRCVTVAADLAQPGAVDQVVAQLAKEFGNVDILVNNAGIGSSADPKPVINFDDNFWAYTLQLNLTVPYLLCKKLVPAMLDRKFGRIINIASTAGKHGLFHGSAYAASKHGLLGFTRSLALEVVKNGITVNAICPGPVLTVTRAKRVIYEAQRTGKTAEEINASATPMGRTLAPEEIASLAVYLASAEAGAITGQAINVDGGLYMA